MLRICFTLCFISYFVAESHAGPPAFIKPCKASDRNCLISNAKAALPYFAKGINELGISSVDPIFIDSIRSDDVNLKLGFRNIKISGASKCHIVDLSRNLGNSTIKLVVECPLIGVGQYDLKGKVVFIEAFGDGDFNIHSDKLKFTVEVRIKNIEKDGKKYWKITGFDYTYELLEKVYIDLKNLFGGDEKRAKPFKDVLDYSWRELIDELGAPLMKQVISNYIRAVSKFFLAYPINELEIA